MRKFIFSLLSMVGIVAFLASCDNHETYADKKAKERDAINRYIIDSAVTVITENEFINKGYTTDVSKNEFVLFSSTGVYMQIVRQGCGEKIKDGETVMVLSRYKERNLMSDTLLSSNDNLTYSAIAEKFRVTRTGSTYSALFVAGNSLMYDLYKTTSVPSGWLVPLSYIDLGRPEKEGDQVAKVRLIVPHSQGQSYATANVYPCLYDISYERGI